MAQTDTRSPHIGYIYPAGGQQGTTFEITAGGQYLTKPDKVYVSGEGVSASVVRYARALNKGQLRDIRKKIGQLQRENFSKLPEKTQNTIARARNFKKDDVNRPQITDEEELRIPNHPLLDNLESMNLRELQNLTRELFNPKKQSNMQIGEIVIIKIVIDSNTAPGERELRIATAEGLTNPLRFEVGTLPEISEPNFNEPKNSSKSPLTLPAVLNGQVMPGEVDSFYFNARRNQRLVIETHARRLIPYLADAVPGWFQATLALYDVNGVELAAADDYRFNPDPVLYYQIPKNGIYELQIRDAIYRGREDFVYRVSVGNQPFISQISPLGGQLGESAAASIDGWNLPNRRLRLDTQSGDEGIREIALQQKKWYSNSVQYSVDTLPECNDVTNNDSIEQSQQVTLPCIVNGRILRPGDIDVFRIDGHADDEIIAEVYSRRLGSPLDSLLRMIDASGKVLCWNDDHEDKQMGLMTHYADSYLSCKLPQDGIYYIQLSDAQNHGGKEYGYRLRISSPQPDFVIYITPSSINIPAGRTTSFCVQVLRKEGFDGDIELALKNAPTGFKLSGQKIDSHNDKIRMTLTAPDKSFKNPANLQIEGRAIIDGNTVRRQALPADEMMQAFAYWHFVPSQELLVSITNNKKFTPTFGAAKSVKIPAGGSTQLRIKMEKKPMLSDIKLELSEPPEGITLESATAEDDEVVLVLKADKKLKSGFKDNLIVDAFTEQMPRRQANNARKNQIQRFWLGVLPAIPVEVVQQ